jgi:hypothetical protein
MTSAVVVVATSPAGPPKAAWTGRPDRSAEGLERSEQKTAGPKGRPSR